MQRRNFIASALALSRFGTMKAAKALGFPTTKPISLQVDPADDEPVYTPFEEVREFDRYALTPKYRDLLERLIGTVNNNEFKGFAPGEVRFLSTNIVPNDDQRWHATFRFGAIPNAENLTVGDTGGISKDGWDYLWVNYENFDDLETLTDTYRIAEVYVEQVYERSDFSLLGVGS